MNFNELVFKEMTEHPHLGYKEAMVIVSQHLGQSLLENPSEVQSVLFDKQDWTMLNAKIWLKKHGYRYGDVHTTDKYLRFRQYEPDRTHAYRIHRFGKGISAILEWPKGEIVGNPNGEGESLQDALERFEREEIELGQKKKEQKPTPKNIDSVFKELDALTSGAKTGSGTTRSRKFERKTRGLGTTLYREKKKKTPLKRAGVHHRVIEEIRHPSSASQKKLVGVFCSRGRKLTQRFIDELDKVSIPHALSKVDSVGRQTVYVKKEDESAAFAIASRLGSEVLRDIEKRVSEFVAALPDETYQKYAVAAWEAIRSRKDIVHVPTLGIDEPGRLKIFSALRTLYLTRNPMTKRQIIDKIYEFLLSALINNAKENFLMASVDISVAQGLIFALTDEELESFQEEFGKDNYIGISRLSGDVAIKIKQFYDIGRLSMNPADPELTQFINSAASQIAQQAFIGAAFIGEFGFSIAKPAQPMPEKVGEVRCKKFPQLETVKRGMAYHLTFTRTTEEKPVTVFQRIIDALITKEQLEVFLVQGMTLLMKAY